MSIENKCDICGQSVHMTSVGAAPPRGFIEEIIVNNYPKLSARFWFTRDAFEIIASVDKTYIGCFCIECHENIMGYIMGLRNKTK